MEKFCERRVVSVSRPVVASGNPKKIHLNCCCREVHKIFVRHSDCTKHFAGMGLLKSIFMPGLMVSLGVGFTHSFASLMKSWDVVSCVGWGCSMFATGALLSFFVNLARGNTARTPRYLTREIFAILTSSTICLLNYILFNGPSGAVLYSWFVASGGTILYVFWFSVFSERRGRRLTVGETLPKFSLHTIDNKLVQSTEFRSKFTLFVFYRGNWCPLCMAQIKEIAGKYRLLHERGVTVVMVSPQSQENSCRLAEKFDAPISFLEDRNNKAARILEIDDPYGVPFGMQLLGYASETVAPTVLIVNSEQKILYSDLTDNYRIRPAPEDFLRIIDSHSEEEKDAKARFEDHFIRVLQSPIKI